MPSTSARQLPQSPARHSVPPRPGTSPAPQDRERDRIARLERDRPAVDDDPTRRGGHLGHWRIRSARRVEQRLRLEPGRSPPPDDLDLEARAAGAVRRRQLGRHVPERDRPLDVVPIAARGHPADDRPVVPDRLVADDVGRVLGVGLDDEGHQPAFRATGGQLGLVRRPPDELVVELE